MATDEQQFEDEEFGSDVDEGDDDVELADLDELDGLDEDYEEENADEADGDQAEVDEDGDEAEVDEADEADHVVEEEDDEEEEEEEESLDVILTREKVIAEEDIGPLDDEPKEALTAPTSPVGAGEFTCRSCFLVKRRAQLADEESMLCLDCA